jgi:hypothetical protein
VIGTRLAVAGVRTYRPAIRVSATTTIASGVSPEDWQGRGYVTRREDGVLVLVYRIGSGHNTAATLSIRFSDDDGATWTAQDTALASDGGGAISGFPMEPPGAGTISYGEGVVLTAPNGDLLIEMWSVDGISSSGTLLGTYQSRSTDEGLTWSEPAAIEFTGNPYTQIRTFMSDDFFVYDGTIYMGARYYEDGNGVPSASMLMTSDDNGTTWDFLSIVCDTDEGGSGGQEFGMEYIGNSTILTFIRDNPHTNSYKRISTDMGATWGALIDVTSTVGNAARQKLYTVAHLRGEANWWEDPEMLMTGFIHNVPGSSQRRTPVVWYSPDRFTTVYGPFGLDGTTDDSGYGDLIGKADGTFAAVNYHGSLTVATLKQYDFTLIGI